MVFNCKATSINSALFTRYKLLICIRLQKKCFKYNNTAFNNVKYLCQTDLPKTTQLA